MNRDTLDRLLNPLGVHLKPLFLLLLGIPIAGCLATPENIGVIHEPLRVCANDETIDGIDVSHHQGQIDWDDVAGEDIRFAFIRVSDGFYEDREFERNWSEARRVGIIRGVYQFFRPGRDARAQADLLLERMGTLEPDDLPPVLDVEDDDGYSASHIVSRMHIWMDRIYEVTGRVPIIYTGKYFWRDEVGGTADFDDHPLWIAQYGRTCPDIPDQWSTWAFWQTSESGSVNGINTTSVDTDLFNGDFDDLMALTEGRAECGDGLCNSGERYATCPVDCPFDEPDPPYESWIGGPCRDHTDCLTGHCLTEADGYPNGMCTERCDLYCPDRHGHPVTFCVSLEGEGHCFSRQSHDHFSSAGCRDDYRAEEVSRHTQPSTVRTVCTPNRVSTGIDNGGILPEPAPDDGMTEPLHDDEVLADIDDIGEPVFIDADGGCSTTGRSSFAPAWVFVLIALALISRRKELKS